MLQTINAQDALSLIKNGEAVLIDVREPDEFKAEHIAYALSVPLSSLDEDFKFLDIPKDKTILFQCFKGTRGQTACERIEESDQCPNKIMNIEGGIEAWKENNFPIISNVSKASVGIPIMRQVQIIAGGLVAILVLLGFAGITLAFIIAGLVGTALFFAGLTGWCGLAMLLAKMPWNTKK